jgi:hypothetical protein
VIAILNPPIPLERFADEAAEVRAARGTAVRFLDIPERRYVAVDGDALPGSELFQHAIGTLFPIAYRLHFAVKARGVDAPIGHLHGLYWIGEPEPLPEDARAGSMQWRLLIGVPAEASVGEVDAAITHAGTAASGIVPRVVEWREGAVAQTLHVGAYDAEGPTVERLRAAIAEAGLRPTGCHHEIYLSGPQTRPERTRTIIRQPVAR